MTTKGFENLKFISAKRILPDISGVCFSFWCLLHCVAMPLIAPLMLVQTPADHWIHIVIITLAIVFAATAIYTNRRQRLRWTVTITLTSGIVLLASAEWFVEGLPEWIEITSGLLISAGHIISLLGKRHG